MNEDIKQKFIEALGTGTLQCPSDIQLEEDCKNNHYEGCDCNECWKRALKDIEITEKSKKESDK